MGYKKSEDQWDKHLFDIEDFSGGEQTTTFDEINVQSKEENPSEKIEEERKELNTE